MFSPVDEAAALVERQEEAGLITAEEAEAAREALAEGRVADALDIVVER